MAFSDTLMMVGKIMMPKTRDAVRILEPDPPNVRRTSGTMTATPKNPYTMEGMPARILVSGFITLYL